MVLKVRNGVTESMSKPGQEVCRTDADGQQPPATFSLLTLHPSAQESKAAKAYVLQPQPQLPGPSNWLRDSYEHPDQLLADIRRGANRIIAELKGANGHQHQGNREPPSALELTMVGVGSLFARRSFPLRAAAKDEGGGASGASGASFIHNETLFGNAAYWAGAGKPQLAEMLTELERTGGPLTVSRLAADETGQILYGEFMVRVMEGFTKRWLT